MRAQPAVLDRVTAWADTAADGQEPVEVLRRVLAGLDDDRLMKASEIASVERDLAAPLAQTPYVLLLSMPGINVVSAAEFAGEMGPIEHYANSRAITGRAGLFPSRYQSDRVDRSDGPLVRGGNRMLRQAIMTIADNLLRCNDHFRGLAAGWRAAGKDPRDRHVKVGSRFCRIAYQMVAGRQVYRHPSCQHRRADHCFKIPIALRSLGTWAAFRRRAAAMLSTPCSLSQPIAAFRKAANTWGPEPVRTRLASSPIVTSRT